MRLITGPNSWSCLLASAAMVMNKHPDVLAEYIGHDGSEIVFPDLKDPARRRGFHVQEIIDCASVYGYAVTPIEALPVSTPDGEREYPVPFMDLGNEVRFRMYLDSHIGIIVGRTRLWGHAVAWDGSQVYDPRGHITSLDDCKIDISTFWCFDKIISN